MEKKVWEPRSRVYFKKPPNNFNKYLKAKKNLSVYYLE
jgi:hypothetical protein